jgi:hypothetical protein
MESDETFLEIVFFLRRRKRRKPTPSPIASAAGMLAPMPILAAKGNPLDGAEDCAVAPGVPLSPPTWELVDDLGSLFDADDELTKLDVDTPVLGYEIAEDVGEGEAVLVCSTAFSAI